MRPSASASPPVSTAWRLPQTLVWAIVLCGGLVPGAPEDVRIDEIHYRPAGDDQALEFVELVNTGLDAVDLSDWRLSRGISFTFPAGTILAGKAYLVVARDAATCRAVFGDVPIVGDSSGVLADRGGRIRLADAAGRIIDECSWEGPSARTAMADGRGASLEKRLPRSESDWPDAWAPSAYVNGTPGRLNSRHPDSVLLRLVETGATWWYLTGERRPPANWAEIDFVPQGWEQGAGGFGYGEPGISTELGDMAGAYSTVYFRHTFVVSGGPEALESLTLRIDYDDAFVAYLNGSEVARSSNVAEEHPENTARATVEHESGMAETFDLSARSGLLVEGVNCLAVHGLNASLGSSDFLIDAELLADRSLEASPHDAGCPVKINEIAPSIAAVGWIELHNPSDAAWDISGYHVSTTPRRADLHTVPDGTVLGPGALFVIDEADLGATLPTAGCVLLTDPTGRFLIDAESYGLSGAPSGSYARHPDGLGSFSVVLTRTRGEPNVPPPPCTVAINEIMYHPRAAPGEEESEWIELLNAGPSTVDLSGWRFVRGITYTVPEGTALGPGEYIVIARDPGRVRDEYGITRVVGGYGSGLRNDDETILILDGLGNTADVVHYADDGAWPVAADGGGPSLELVNPACDNRSGQAWAASAGTGTPGARNGAYRDRVPPIIERVRHSPAVPSSTTPVTVTCEISSPTAPIGAVELTWRTDGSETSSIVPMADDGDHGDGSSGDGVWGAMLDPQPDGTITSFVVSAMTADGLSRVVPSPGQTARPQAMLCQVSDNLSPWEHPTYRIIMTADTLRELQSRDVWSDVLLDATFIAGDEIFYGAGIRYRGRASRISTPKSYRVRLADDDKFLGMKRLNLNSSGPERQHLGMALFRASDVPTSRSRMIRLFVGNEEFVRYVHMEAVDDGFIERRFPDDGGGNLYRGLLNADLNFRGPDKELYREHYPKLTNEELDDFSDIIELCDLFTSTPDDRFASTLSAAIDAEEWARFFAVHTLLNTQDGVYRHLPDDYFLYHRPSDGRFAIIPWDTSWTFTKPEEDIVRSSIAFVDRFLSEPAFAPFYFGAMRGLFDGLFSPAAFGAAVKDIEACISSSRAASLVDYATERPRVFEERLRPGVTARLEPLLLVRSGDSWRHAKGIREPSGGTLDWTLPEFDDAAWGEAPSGFGYGDGDDATSLDDMRGSYSTVYIRKRFAVEELSWDELVLTVDVDDGFVAYLNGIEIARCNAPGEPGVAVPHDACAPAAHEVGVPVTFPVRDARRILRVGANVLAVQGLNVSRECGDFSLAPGLGAGSIVATRGDMTYVAGTALAVRGTASVIETRNVSVNGIDAAFDPFTGAFESSVAIRRGAWPVAVEALRADMTLAGSRRLEAVGVTSFGGVAQELTTCDAAGSPYLVASTVTVPAGHTLVIEPGVTFLMEEGARLVIEGCIQARGTEEQPILLAGARTGVAWGGVALRRTREDNRFVRCTFRGVASGSALSLEASAAAVDGCRFEEIGGAAVEAHSSDLDLRASQIAGVDAAVSIEGPGAVAIEGCSLRCEGGEGAGIDVRDVDEPVSIGRCAIEAPNGTGIRAQNAAVLARSNEIRGCDTAAMHLVGPARSIIAQNAIHGCGIGLWLGDSHRAVVDHATVVDNETCGIRLSEVTSGRGGGHAEVTSSIVYFNPEAFAVGPGSTIGFAYCATDLDPLPPGPGNIGADPLFVERAGRNYALHAASPCIGAGAEGSDVGAIPFDAMPLAPRDLRITGTTATSIALAWVDRSVNEDGFELHRRAAGDQQFALLQTLPAGAVSAVDEPLPPGAACSYRLRSFNGSGYSAWSDEAEATAGSIPQAPGELTVTDVSPTSISIAWQDRSADEAGFEIERLGHGDATFRFLARIGPDVTAFTDGDPPLREGDVYVYRVRAYGAQGPSGWSNEVAQRAGRAPDAPQDLRVTGAGPASVSIAWRDAAADETAYVVCLQRDGGGPWQRRAVLGPDVTSFTDVGLRPGHAYGYRVRAENEVGSSAWAGPVIHAFGAVPPQPLDLSIAGIGIDWIELAWRDDGADGAAREIERSVDVGEFVLRGTLGAGESAYVDQGLERDTRYSYRVRATAAAASSPWSNVVSGTTGKLPGTPQNVRIAGAGLTSLAIAWDDSSDNETGFELERRSGASPWTAAASVPAGHEGYTDENLASGAAYAYRVRAASPFGSSDWSAEATGSTGSLPAAPADAAVVDAGRDYLIVTWTDRSEDELYFEIERRLTTDQVWWIVGWISPDMSSFLDRGLPFGHGFFYRVRAWNVFGASAYSNEAYGFVGEAPGAPSGLRETRWSASAIELVWESGGAEDWFTVRRRSDGEPFKDVVLLPRTTTRWMDLSVKAGTVYTYVVLAGNALGISEPSAPLTTAAGIALLGVVPGVGSIDGGEAITIQGIHLAATTIIAIGGRELLDQVRVSDSAVTGVTPACARAGPADVTATDGLLTGSLPGGFQYARGLLRGDADGNLRLNVSDAVMLVRSSYGGGAPLYCDALGDVNADSVVNVSDAVFLLRYLFTAGPPPTPARLDCR